MAVRKDVSLLVFGVLVVARCARAFSYSDVAGFHGHEFSMESVEPYSPTKEHFAKVEAAHQGGVRNVDDRRTPQPNSPTHVNPPAQFSAVDDVHSLQPGSSQSPDIHSCIAHYQCSEPMPVCLNGRCVRPPQVFRSNYGFNRGGAVLPTYADKGNKGFNRGGAVLPTHADKGNKGFNRGGAVPSNHADKGKKGFNRGGAVLPGWML